MSFSTKALHIASGSGNFKGSAGVLAKAISLLQAWAKEQQSNKKRN
ncbi:MAG TPA: hypothetical protein VN040_21790 [Pseudosphingobacterium sp.]|nr:hypothetical protein [Pseudosphingobacterium sp.]